MQRIDSVNARPSQNGTNKAGFNDNSDLPGQDATYLTPNWLNHLQEELCNILELNGYALDSTSRQQLYDVLATKTEVAADILALAEAIESNFLRKTANAVSASKLLTARNIALTGAVTGNVNFNGTGDVIIATTATAVSSKTANGYSYLSSGLIVQWVQVEAAGNYTFPLTFPTACLSIFASNKDGQGSYIDNAFAYALSASSFYYACKANTGAITGYAGSVLAIGY